MGPDPIAGLPEPCVHVDLVADGNGFWFAGGMKDKPTRKIKDHIIAEVWYFNLELDRYTAGPLLPGCRGGGLARLGDKLHYVSGLMEDRDTDSPDHFVLDLKEWAEEGMPCGLRLLRCRYREINIRSPN